MVPGVRERGRCSDRSSKPMKWVQFNPENYQDNLDHPITRSPPPPTILIHSSYHPPTPMHIEMRRQKCRTSLSAVPPAGRLLP